MSIAKYFPNNSGKAEHFFYTNSAWRPYDHIGHP